MPRAGSKKNGTTKDKQRKRKAAAARVIPVQHDGVRHREPRRREPARSALVELELVVPGWGEKAQRRAVGGGTRGMAAERVDPRYARALPRMSAALRAADRQEVTIALELAGDDPRRLTVAGDGGVIVWNSPR